jgi:outer membrane protein assembly factor BamE (lipoprotein component of BamABCDE complex)
MHRETNARQRRTRQPTKRYQLTGYGARLAACMIVAASGLALAACEPNILKHGAQFHESDLQQVQPGMTQDQVRMTLGTPSTTAVVGNNQAYYYISSTATQTSFMLPTEQERQVIAVYFTQGGTVERVANYGLKDGRVFDFVSRTTPAPGGREDGIVQALFRNLGQKQIFGD